MSRTNYIVNRGTDFVLSFTWKDTDNNPQDLTGWDISLMDVSVEIEDYIEAEIVDAIDGVVSVRIEWDESFSLGVAYLFRVQVTSGLENVSTNLQEVVYQ